MKKCASELELELEAFIREDAAEQKPGRASAGGTTAFGGSRNDGVFSAGCISGFGFGDTNTLNGNITNNLWSQNLNARHPAVSTTIESQSSFCVTSSTSATNLNGKENQAPGVTSGSDSDSESLLDTEGGPYEQSKNPMDMKRMRRFTKDNSAQDFVLNPLNDFSNQTLMGSELLATNFRMVSNRESARRSRKRKQAQLTDLESQVEQLRGEHASLFKQLTDANQQFTTAVTDNRILKSDVEALRVKVKMAEDMVARGALSCGLGHLGLTPILNPRQATRTPDVITGLEFAGDDACFTGLSSAEQVQNSPIQSIASLESMENWMPSDGASCGVDMWSWDSHSNGMSK